MKRQSYPSDVTDEEWAILESLIPPAKASGHPRTTDRREVLNAILYLDRTGCQWRALPHDFPRLYHGLDLLSVFRSLPVMGYISPSLLSRPTLVNGSPSAVEDATCADGMWNQA